MCDAVPIGVSKYVLLVEDEPQVAEAVQRLLSFTGHRAVGAESGAAARAAGRGFDVGVFDIHLEGEIGVDIAAELLETGAVGRAIFLSATQDRDLKARARELGVFLAKQEIASLIAEVECCRRRDDG